MKITKPICSLIVAALFACLLMVPSLCLASVPVSEVSLGGIALGSSPDYVYQIYGRPDHSSTTYSHPLWTGKVTDWRYGNSVNVTFRNDQVIHVDVSANNGFATPAGITVGMKSSVPQNLYGSPDKHSSSFMFYSAGNDYQGVRFQLRNGVITVISIGWFD